MGLIELTHIFTRPSCVRRQTGDPSMCKKRWRRYIDDLHVSIPTSQARLSTSASLPNTLVGREAEEESLACEVVSISTINRANRQIWLIIKQLF